MEQVDAEVTKLAPCKSKVKLVVKKPLVEKFTNEVYKEIQKEAVVQGFRKGSVPMDIIKMRYGSMARERVINRTLNETLFPVLKEKNINFVENTLEIKKFDFDENKDCVYELEMEVVPEFKLKNYKGLKLKKEVRKVSEKDLEDALKELLERNAKLVVSSKEKISKEDILEGSNLFCVIDYKVYFENNELKDMEGKNVLIELASGALPAGLKEGLVGMARNEQKRIKVILPANFPKPELISKEVELDLKIIEIKEKQLPLLDDELAKDFGYKTLDELKSAIKQNIQLEYDRAAEHKLKQQIYEELIKEHSFELPQKEVENYEKKLIETMKRNFISRGGKEEDFKITEEEQKQLKQKSKDEIKLKYILEKIVKEEGINVSQEEIEKEKGKYKKMYPGREKEVEELFTKNIDQIVSQILEDKIIEVIKTNAKIKEVEVSEKK